MSVDDTIRHEQNENDEFSEGGAQKVNHRLEHGISSRWPMPGRKLFGYIRKNVLEAPDAERCSLLPGVYFITFEALNPRQISPGDLTPPRPPGKRAWRFGETG
jgi:hypothetical protein